MKQVSWDNCGQCPFVQTFTGGKKLACGHGDTIFRHPYANDRFVEMHTIPTFCPVPDMLQPDTPIVFLEDVPGYAQKDDSGVIIKPFDSDGRAMVKTDEKEVIFYATTKDFTVVCGMDSMERTT